MIKRSIKMSILLKSFVLFGCLNGNNAFANTNEVSSGSDPNPIICVARALLSASYPIEPNYAYTEEEYNQESGDIHSTNHDINAAIFLYNACTYKLGLPLSGISSPLRMKCIQNLVRDGITRADNVLNAVNQCTDDTKQVVTPFRPSSHEYPKPSILSDMDDFTLCFQNSLTLSSDPLINVKDKAFGIGQWLSAACATVVATDSIVDSWCRQNMLASITNNELAVTSAAALCRQDCAARSPNCGISKTTIDCSTAKVSLQQAFQTIDPNNINFLSPDIIGVLGSAFKNIRIVANSTQSFQASPTLNNNTNALAHVLYHNLIVPIHDHWPVDPSLVPSLQQTDEEIYGRLQTAIQNYDQVCKSPE